MRVLHELFKTIRRVRYLELHRTTPLAQWHTDKKVAGREGLTFCVSGSRQTPPQEVTYCLCRRLSLKKPPHATFSAAARDSALSRTCGVANNTNHHRQNLDFACQRYLPPR